MSSKFSSLNDKLYKSVEISSIGTVGTVRLLKGKAAKLLNFIGRSFAYSSTRSYGSFILSFGLMGIMTVVIFRAVDTGWFEKEPVTTYEYNGHQFKIYHDELPLTVEDMMDAESDRYSYEMRVEDSWLLTHYEAYQNVRMNAELPEMRYDIFIPKLPGLYDFCLENIMEDFLEEDPSGEFGYCFMDSDTSLWGAEKVYQYQMDHREMDRYLVCYEDYIVRITFYWTPEEEQLRTAGEKFTDFKDWASR